jgi:hypothetical protein
MKSQRYLEGWKAASVMIHKCGWKETHEEFLITEDFGVYDDFDHGFQDRIYWRVPMRDKDSADLVLATHSFIFNPKDNGGEALTLKTVFYDNGDGIPKGIYIHQELELQSYSNSVTYNLIGATLTPENLRQLADELETVRNVLLAANS